MLESPLRPRNRRSVFCLLLILTCAPVAGLLHAQEVWTRRTSGISETLAGVAYGGNRWVAVGEAGRIITSPDAITWTTSASGTAQDLRAVTYGVGQFVAVGNMGTILTSPNGVTWTPRASGTTSFLSGIAYGNGRFVAVAGAGGQPRAVHSTDGITWTPAATMINWSLQSVSFNNGLYIAVGSNFGAPAKRILRSTDGSTWLDTIPAVPSTIAYTGTTFFKNTYFACGLSGYIATSPTGETWTNLPTPGPETARAMAASPSQIVVVGDAPDDNATEAPILTSQDGVNWVTRTSGVGLFNAALHGVAYGNDLFVAVGSAATIEPFQSIILTSPATAPGITVAAAVDAPDNAWSSSGTGIPWVGQDSVTHDGIDAASSVGGNVNTSSTLATTVEGPTTITFFWKISAVAGDGLTVKVDGTEVTSIAGETDWTSGSVTIPGGTHAVSWTFARSGDPATGQNGAWVDEVVIPPADYSVATWLTLHFNETELMDPALSGLARDPENDTLPTLLEYLLDLDPRLSNAASPRAPVFSLVTGEDGMEHAAFTFTRRIVHAPFVETGIEFSLELEEFGWGIVDSTEEILSTDGDFETVRLVEDAPYQSEGPIGFYRVYVSTL